MSTLSVQPSASDATELRGAAEMQQCTVAPVERLQMSSDSVQAFPSSAMTVPWADDTQQHNTKAGRSSKISTGSVQRSDRNTVVIPDVPNA